MNFSHHRLWRTEKWWDKYMQVGKYSAILVFTIIFRGKCTSFWKCYDFEISQHWVSFITIHPPSRFLLFWVFRSWKSKAIKFLLWPVLPICGLLFTVSFLSVGIYVYNYPDLEHLGLCWTIWKLIFYWFGSINK